MEKRSLIFNNARSEVLYSVIIPVFNEEVALIRKEHYSHFISSDTELIFADGGSDDDTVKLAKNMGAIVVNSDKGRGSQMNAGATAARGKILIFLHADTELPPNWKDLLHKVFADANVHICRFLLGFDINHSWLNFYSFFSRFNTTFTSFGDSAIIVRKVFFDQINGFNNFQVFEDVDFFTRAKKLTTVHIIPHSVISSARRFITNGIIKQQLLNIFLHILYIAGVSPGNLAIKYNSLIKGSKFSALLLFIRYPVAGKVKTRLAAHTSPEFAKEVYTICLHSLLHEAKKLSEVKKFAAYSDAAEKAKVNNLVSSDCFTFAQQGDDLGMRMQHAFHQLFLLGAGSVIICGSDVPEINSELIQLAFLELSHADVVIGPSADGGYYLLGMRQYHPELFSGIVYSTSTVLKETLAITSKLGLNVFLLPELPDIDTLADLENWLNTRQHKKLHAQLLLLYNAFRRSTS